MPTISNAEYACLLASRDALAELRNLRVAREFAWELGTDLLVALAATPLDAWPELALVALEHATRRSPGGAVTYRSLLPRAARDRKEPGA